MTARGGVSRECEMPRNIAAPDKPRKPLIRLRKALVSRRIATARSNGDSSGLFSTLPETSRGPREGLRPPPGPSSLPEDSL